MGSILHYKSSQQSFESKVYKYWCVHYNVRDLLMWYEFLSFFSSNVHMLLYSSSKCLTVFARMITSGGRKKMKIMVWLTMVQFYSGDLHIKSKIDI